MNHIAIDRLRESAGHLLVRRAVDRDDWVSEAVLDIATGNQRLWTPKQWSALLKDLRRCPGTLDDWLDLNA